MRFKLRDELFYYTNFNNKKKRLYIFNIFEKKIFEFAYNRQYYKNFYRIYNRIANFIYFKYLSKYLCIYIDYYFEYKFNQIKRYKFYKNINFINKSSISFYIIIINFVIIFLIIINDCDYFFTRTNKFSKRTLIFSDKIIYNVVK